jgi:hypothetical protein
MKERPILFSTPMVKAILEGRKTVTRRVIKDESVIDTLNMIAEKGAIQIIYRDWCEDDPEEGDGVHPPEWVCYDEERDWVYPMGQGYGNEGDVLWVRETWKAENIKSHDEFESGIRFTADNTWVKTDSPMVRKFWEKHGEKTQPSIFLPKDAARIKLLIKSISVERLHDITLSDVLKEGLEVRQFSLYGADEEGRNKVGRIHFGLLWESINGKESWDSNPWVWRIEFEKL